MYVSCYPCKDRAKIIIQSGIKSVVYYARKKEKTEAAQMEEDDKCKDPPNLMQQNMLTKYCRIIYLTVVANIDALM